MEEQEKRYIIIKTSNPEDMEEKVNEAIEQGYQPIGNLIVTTSGRYVQPLFKQDMSMLENLTKQFGGL